MNPIPSERTRIAVNDHEAAALLGVSPSTLRAWRRTGRGPDFARLGRRVVYPLTALEQFMRLHVVRKNGRGVRTPAERRLQAERRGGT